MYDVSSQVVRLVATLRLVDDSDEEPDLRAEVAIVREGAVDKDGQFSL